MANIQQITREYKLRASSEGVDQVIAKTQALGGATDLLAAKTETVTKSQLSASAALERQQRQLDLNYRSMKQLENAKRDLDRAQQQGLIGQARHTELLALASARYQAATQAANDNDSALQRLGNTLTRRVIFAFLIREVKEAAFALFNLNAELAKTGDIARRVGANSGSFQGIDFAATVKGVKDFPGAMLKFNDQVDRARAGLGDLATLFRVNRLTVGSTEDAFLRVADLVRNSASEAQKFSILQQAGLPATREMARLMEQGAESIRKQAAEATKFSDEQLRRAQELDDKFNEMWAGFVRGAKKAFLEIADFPQEGSTLRFLLDVAQGKKEFKIKFALQAEPGSILDRLTGGGGALPAVPIIPVTKGLDLAPPSGTRLTVTPGGTTVDPARVKELLALEQQRIGVMGQLATIEQQVRSVEIGIQLARLGGVKVTKDEESALLSLARAQALGTAQIQQQADAQRIEAAALLMSAGQAVAYRVVWDKVYDAKRAGRPLNEEQIRQLQKEATELGRLTDQTALLRDLERAASSAFSGIVGDIASGTIGIDQMIGRLNALGKSLTDIGSKSLFDSLKTGLTGGGFSFDPVSLGIGAAGIGISLVGQYFEGQKKAEAEAQKAQLAWKDMTAEVHAFNAEAPKRTAGDPANDNSGCVQQLDTLPRDQEKPLDGDQWRRAA